MIERGGERERKSCRGNLITYVNQACARTKKSNKKAKEVRKIEKKQNGETTRERKVYIIIIWKGNGQKSDGVMIENMTVKEN